MMGFNSFNSDGLLRVSSNTNYSRLIAQGVFNFGSSFSEALLPKNFDGSGQEYLMLCRPYGFNSLIGAFQGAIYSDNVRPDWYRRTSLWGRGSWDYKIFSPSEDPITENNSSGINVFNESGNFILNSNYEYPQIDQVLYDPPKRAGLRWCANGSPSGSRFRINFNSYGYIPWILINPFVRNYGGDSDGSPVSTGYFVSVINLTTLEVSLRAVQALFGFNCVLNDRLFPCGDEFLSNSCGAQDNYYHNAAMAIYLARDE